MKKFLLKIVLFSVIIVAINFYISDSITIGRIFYGYLDTKDDVIQEKPTCVLLGDSHVLPLKQEYLPDSVFNFSYHTESYADMYIKLQYLLRNDSRIDRLIIPVDYHCISTYRKWSNNKRLSIVYSSYSDYKDVYNTSYFKYLYNKFGVYVPMLHPSNSELLRKYYIRYWENKIRPKFRFNREEQKVHSYSAPVMSNKKIAWEERSLTEQTKNAEKRFESQFKSNYDESMQNALIKIVETCEECDIELIGIRFPLTELYYDMIAQKDFERQDSLFQALDFKIYDYSQIYFGRDSLFRDQDHLNEQEGAKLFIDQIEDLLINKKGE
jgi:hypothetical protein